tara:strand:- start:3087 stop:3524 length:438 start_codon:yes stop_codon:yes gene_type:complete
MHLTPYAQAAILERDIPPAAVRHCLRHGFLDRSDIISDSNLEHTLPLPSRKPRRRAPLQPSPSLNPRRARCGSLAVCFTPTASNSPCVSDAYRHAPGAIDAYRHTPKPALTPTHTLSLAPTTSRTRKHHRVKSNPSWDFWGGEED